MFPEGSSDRVISITRNRLWNRFALLCTKHLFNQGERMTLGANDVSAGEMSGENIRRNQSKASSSSLGQLYFPSESKICTSSVGHHEDTKQPRKKEKSQRKMTRRSWFPCWAMRNHPQYRQISESRQYDTGSNWMVHRGSALPPCVAHSWLSARTRFHLRVCPVAYQNCKTLPCWCKAHTAKHMLSRSFFFFFFSFFFSSDVAQEISKFVGPCTSSVSIWRSRQPIILDRRSQVLILFPHVRSC